MLFLFIFSVGKMNVTLTILVVFEWSAEGLEKAFIDFSNNTFPKETGIINLLYYMWRTLFFIKRLNFNEYLEI